MIRGRLQGGPGRLRPFITAHLSIASQGIGGDADFLIDTGADVTLLAPTDALRLGIDTEQLPAGPPSTGVGGIMPTVYANATITLGEQAYSIPLRILAPRVRAQRRALGRIPSLVGRDILSHFALFFEERTERVLLLEPPEADALPLL
jgi:hypothetical protein